MKPVDVFALAWIASLSVVTFLVFGYDKWRAARQGSRVPENTLLMLGALGGWPGGWIAMKVFRHKTAKGMFQIFYLFALIPFAAGIGAWVRWR